MTSVHIRGNVCMYDICNMFRICLTDRLTDKCNHKFEILNIAPERPVCVQSIIRNKFSARIYPIRNAFTTLCISLLQYVIVLQIVTEWYEKQSQYHISQEISHGY